MTKTKPNISTIGNDGGYNYIAIYKSKGLLTILAKSLIKIGAYPEYVNAMLADKGFCEVSELVEKGRKIKEADITKMTDRRFNFCEKGFNIDIIFGKDKVFLIGCMTEDKRSIMTKLLMKECRFIRKPKAKAD